MTPTPAHRIGQALARLGRRAADRDPDDDLPGEERATRVEILVLLRDSDQPLTVDDLCRATGKHTNTIRTHLDLLRASGTITRVKGPAKGRGRPPWLYLADPEPETEADDLLKELIRADLKHTDDETLAREAANRWADDHRQPPGSRAETDGEAVNIATDALNQVGFRATVSGAGDTIEIVGCPYADFIADHPVICDIHTALLGEVLERTGRPVRVSRMDVWQPGNCVAHLRGPQIQPHRSIVPDDQTEREHPRNRPTSRNPANQPAEQPGKKHPGHSSEDPPSKRSKRKK